jgi:hypothetical protein
VDHQGNYRNDQQQVNQTPGDVKGEKPKHPHHQQDNKQYEKHRILLARSSTPLLNEHI